MPKYYDWFIDDNPKIKERVAKGRAEGRVEGMQGAIIRMIKARFPDLETSAQQKLASIADVDELNRLLPQIVVASSVADIRKILGLPVA